MGLFGDLMGVKLELSKPYTLEELYELIKDVPFEAGHPQIAYHGPTGWIVFPQMDRNNQVVIGGKPGKYNCMRTPQPIGLDKALGNVMMDNLTGGLSGFSAAFGKTKKRCEELARKTGEQINSMHL